MKILAFILMTALLLAACTVETEEENKNISGTESQKIIETEKTEEIKTPSSWDIQIVDSKLDPTNINLNLGVSNTITIHNAENKINRFEIPQLDVFEDIDADGYAIVTVTPKYKGYYPLEINGVQMGTAIVK